MQIVKEQRILAVVSSVALPAWLEYEVSGSRRSLDFSVTVFMDTKIQLFHIERWKFSNLTKYSSESKCCGLILISVQIFSNQFTFFFKNQCIFFKLAWFFFNSVYFFPNSLKPITSDTKKKNWHAGNGCLCG